jgi:carbon storage regulator CsrA
MLVLSRRLNEKLVFPAFQTSVEVTAIHPGGVRLGVEAPPEVCVLTEEAAAREVRGSAAPTDRPPTLLQIDQLVQKRLEIARLGLTELRRRVRRGDEFDAEAILDQLDEDLHLLQRRVRREAGKAMPPPRRRTRARAGGRLPRRPR